MITRGSQKRFSLQESGLKVHQRLPDNRIVLEDTQTGERDLYVLRDDFAGAVVEVDGKGYEFVSGWSDPNA